MLEILIFLDKNDFDFCLYIFLNSEKNRLHFVFTLKKFFDFYIFSISDVYIYIYIFFFLTRVKNMTCFDTRMWHLVAHSCTKNNNIWKIYEHNCTKTIYMDFRAHTDFNQIYLNCSFSWRLIIFIIPVNNIFSFNHFRHAAIQQPHWINYAQPDKKKQEKQKIISNPHYKTKFAKSG